MITVMTIHFRALPLDFWCHFLLFSLPLLPGVEPIILEWIETLYIIKEKQGKSDFYMSDTFMNNYCIKDRPDRFSKPNNRKFHHMAWASKVNPMPAHNAFFCNVTRCGKTHDEMYVFQRNTAFWLRIRNKNIDDTKLEQEYMQKLQN